MGVGADLLGDLGQMDRHRLAADPGHDDGRTDGPRRADRAEDVGGVMAVVANPPPAGATPRPQGRQRTPLADPPPILEPNLARPSRPPPPPAPAHAGREAFFKSPRP